MDGKISRKSIVAVRAAGWGWGMEGSCRLLVLLFLTGALPLVSLSLCLPTSPIRVCMPTGCGKWATRWRSSEDRGCGFDISRPVLACLVGASKILIAVNSDTDWVVIAVTAFIPVTVRAAGSRCTLVEMKLSAEQWRGRTLQEDQGNFDQLSSFSP